MTTTAIILAGGFGTRLRSVVSEVPKPMAPVNGWPFLVYQMRYLKNQGVKHVILSLGYMPEVIINYFGNKFEGLSISYVREDSPLGTGGGIRLAMLSCQEKDVIVLNGDSFFDVDLREMSSFYDDQHLEFILASRKVDDASRYGTLEVSGEMIRGRDGVFTAITSFREKQSDRTNGVINGGIYILNCSTFLSHTVPDENFSIEKEYFELNVGKLKCGTYISKGYFIDIGIPEDYSKAQLDFKEFKYR